MSKSFFPDPRQSTEEGLVAVGGNLSPEILLDAYQNGIFPWPQEGAPMLWFSPDPRGVLDFSELHIPRSLRKWRRQHSDWQLKINTDFAAIIHHCQQQPRPGQDGTWILPEVESAYRFLQQMENSPILSVSCYENGILIGGIYGLLTKMRTGQTVFSGESMFYLKDNASKICLWFLVEHLQSLGHTWMDIQMVTSVSEVIGGKYISREDFLDRIGR